MQKKADLTNKATSGSVANVVNPFSAFYGGDTWAPKFMVDSPSNSKDREVMYKAVVGFLGAGALAAAVRGFMATQQGYAKENTKDIINLPRPTSNAPVSPEDLAAARKGDLVAPETNLDTLVGEIPDAATKAYKGVSDFVSGKHTPATAGHGKKASVGRWAQLALPVAGLSAGAAMGYNLVDSVVEDTNKSKLTAETAKKEALLRKLVAARALNARGMLDEHTYTKMMDQVSPYMPPESVVKTASEKKANFFEEPVGRLYGLAGALLATSFAVSAYITKKQTDANDPARIKMKAYQEGLKRYANEKMLNSPVLMGTPDQKVLEALDNNNEPAALPATDYAPRSPVSIPL